MLVFSNGVQVLVDVLRDGIDTSMKLILNLEEFLLVIFRNEVYGETKVAETTRPTDSV
jgi:hypothetical protein